MLMRVYIQERPANVQRLDSVAHEWSKHTAPESLAAASIPAGTPKVAFSFG